MVTPSLAVAGLWLLLSPVWSDTLPTSQPNPETPAVSAAEEVVGPEALLDLSDAELLARIQTDPRVLGPLSIGGPGSGQLFNAVAMPAGPLWEIGAGAQPWATTETIEALEAGIETVHELFPESHPIRFGDFSDSDGGRLKRHLSHQVGRDVDVGFYLKGGAPGGFVVGTQKNFDLPRNWALLRAWVVRTDVDVVLLDRRIQKLLYQYALSIGEDKAWLDRVFQYPRGLRDTIVQHVANHRNHYHVRFFNPVAQELGRRAFPLLVEARLMDPPAFTVRHVVRPGQTMGHVASRYGTSIRAIMQANGLRTTNWRAGRSYRIPVKGTVNRAEAVVVPPRLLPPYTPPVLDGVAWPTAAQPAAGGDESR